NLRISATPIGYNGNVNGIQVTPPAEYNTNFADAILLTPNAKGRLNIFAGEDIPPTRIAMLDVDPNFLPGLFTLGGAIIQSADRSTYGSSLFYQYEFPTVLSSFGDIELEAMHTRVATHANDFAPIYIYAGGDIGASFSGVTLSTPKQTRV